MPADDSSAGQFVTTRWTAVIQAHGDSPEAKTALSELCAAYYAPVFAYIRRTGQDEDKARDLTQEFFARLLKGRRIEKANPQQGRFRSYLLGAVKHFLADARDHASRLKRGGGQGTQPLDAGTDTTPGLQVPDPNALAPDQEFDRRWALTLLDRALTLLESEHTRAGKAEQFQAFKPWLTGDSESLSQAETAKTLGLSEGAAKVAIHRLRRRFRELIKHEIAQTVTDKRQVDEELRDLFEALT